MSKTASLLINEIINRIEGGYYHPDMKAKLRGGENMLSSGETMFGIDRANGGNINTSAEGVAFWNLIDANYSDKHGNTAYYNDMADGKKIPANVGKQLRQYVEQIIMNLFNTNVRFLSDGAKKIVLSSPELLLQFLYACWNGSGNFQKFANIVNAAYQNGERNAKQLYNLVQEARRSRGGLWKKGADKLDVIVANLRKSKGWLWLALAVLGIYLICKN